MLVKIRTFLFYGYLVAILVTATIAARNFRHIDRAAHVGQAQSAAIKAQQVKLCTAIAGAVQFWILVRASTESALSDPSLSPIARKADEQYVVALNAVIERGTRLACIRSKIKQP